MENHNKQREWETKRANGDRSGMTQQHTRDDSCHKTVRFWVLTGTHFVSARLVLPLGDVWMRERLSALVARLFSMKNFQCELRLGLRIAPIAYRSLGYRNRIQRLLQNRFDLALIRMHVSKLNGEICESTREYLRQCYSVAIDLKQPQVKCECRWSVNLFKSMEMRNSCSSIIHELRERNNTWRRLVCGKAITFDNELSNRFEETRLIYVASCRLESDAVCRPE